MLRFFSTKSSHRSASRSRRRNQKRPLTFERLDSRQLMAADVTVRGVTFSDQVASCVPSPPTAILGPVFANTFSTLQTSLAQRKHVVNTNSDSIANDGKTSLREALNVANSTPGLDWITFDPVLAGKTIMLNDRALGALRVTDDLIIQGWGDNLDTLPDERPTIDGSGADGYGTRVFEIDDGRLDRQINVEISGVVIANGWTRAQDGAGLRNFENTRLKDVKLADNRAHWEIAYARNETSQNWKALGGAIANYHNLQIVDSEILRNSSATSEGGGAIYNAGQMQIVNSKVFGNTAAGEGGGILNAPKGRLELSQATIALNRANGAGGGVSNKGIMISDRTLIGSNDSLGAQGGGGLFNSGTGNSAIINSDFVLNKVYGSTIYGRSIGGAAILSSGTLFVDGSRFVQNAVNVPTLTETNQAGGAIYVSGGLVDIKNSIFHTNKAKTGGAVFASSGTVTVRESQFIKNESLIVGSAPTSMPTVVGPAISNSQGKVTVDRKTTFADNKLNVYGNSRIAAVNYEKTQRSLEF